MVHIKENELIKLFSAVDELQELNNDVLNISVSLIIRNENAEEYWEPYKFAKYEGDYKVANSDNIESIDFNIRNKNGKTLQNLSILSSMEHADEFIRTLKISVFKSSILALRPSNG